MPARVGHAHHIRHRNAFRPWDAVRWARSLTISGSEGKIAASLTVLSRPPELDREEAAMSEFPKCLLIVTAEVDPAVEADWNRWYDTVHLPDALRCPGVRGGRRYVSSGQISETASGKTQRTAKR